jgi:hypothetical protein
MRNENKKLCNKTEPKKTEPKTEVIEEVNN